MLFQVKRWMLCAGAAAALLANVPVGAATINEIRIDHTGSDVNEFIELAGTANESLEGLSIVVIGDGAAALGSGVVERVFSLSGLSIPTDGHFLAAGTTDMPAYTGESVDLDLTPNTDIFENGDTLTFFLVSGNTATAGTDLDTNDDGTFDSTWFTAAVDSVSVLDDASELPYSSTQVGPDGTNPPAAVSRFPTATGPWQFSSTSFASFDGDTPGTANTAIPEPAGLAAVGLVAALGLRRRR
jgi:uncharacterized protein